MTEIQTNGIEDLAVRAAAVRAAVEHHVSSYQQVVSERDELQRQNDKQEQLITVYKIENEGLRAELAAERSRTASYQSERDIAVSERAEYAVKLDMLRKLLEKPPETLG